jgi:hypothetical protein
VSTLRLRPKIIVLVAGVAIVALITGAVGYVVVSGGGSAGPSGPAGAPHFVEETATSGVSHTDAGPAIYDTGGGVAVFDCNGDGKPDIYAAGGTNPAALYVNQSPVGGSLKFAQPTDPVTDLTGVTGAYPIDIFGDGQTDLVVLRIGETEVLRGLGGCKFQDVTQSLGIPTTPAFGSAFSAAWEGSNSLPTLAIGHYRKLDSTGKPTLDCDSNILLRPKAGGSSYDQPIDLTPGYCTLSLLFSDWDLSGRRDLRATNDRNYYVNGQDQLWKVEPGQPPTAYTDQDGWVSLQVFGMGIASYDVTGSGYPDYFITSQGDNHLQTLTAGPDQPMYRDVASKRGVNAAAPFTGGDILPSTAWHPEFQDVNNDGYMDLFISKGNIGGQPDYAKKDPNDLFLGQADGTFKEAADAAGVLNMEQGRGAALADFNLDGMLDLVEVNYGSPMKIWRNAGTGDASKAGRIGNWLAIRPHQSGANADAIGGWLEVKTGTRTIRRELTIGGGHAGGQLGWMHFGLGSSSSAQVRVAWPDGQTGPWLTVNANQFVNVERGASQAQPWSPKPGSTG